MRYFLVIAYRGTNYHGWQRQKNACSIQQEIEDALTTILQTPISIAGSGRTDTGVHAAHQVAHVDLDEKIDTKDLIYKLNVFLAKEISIKSIKKVSENAHARFDAIQRTYHYHIHNKKDPFLYDLSYYFHDQLNTKNIQSACEILKKWNNFECFGKLHTDVTHFNCTLSEATWITKKHGYSFVISADRFLRGMVRSIVGTLIDIGQNRTSLENFKKILESNDRTKAGRSVPAKGLFLTNVMYHEDDW